MPDRYTITDEALVNVIRSEDTQQFAELVNRYEDKLLRYATHLLGDDQKAMDVVQDSFIKAYINLQSFDVRKKFSSWMYRIVHNEAINSAKKYRKEIPMPDEMEYESNENIEQDFTKYEIVESAHMCLGKMPVLYREPLTLHFLENKSYDEISDILRIPMGTVATRINRAKSMMKKLCQKNN